MPLCALGDLLSYSRKREEEQRLFSMWLTAFAASQLTGQKVVDYAELLREVEHDAATERKGTQRSGADILADYAPLFDGTAK